MVVAAHPVGCAVPSPPRTLSGMTKKLIVAPAAAVTGAVTYALLHWVLGLGLQAGGRTVTLPAVLIASAVAALAGWSLLALLSRVTAHPRRSWTVIALTTLVISLAGPLSAGSLPTILALISLHLTVGTTVITVLRDRPGRTAGR